MLYKRVNESCREQIHCRVFHSIRASPCEPSNKQVACSDPDLINITLITKLNMFVTNNGCLHLVVELVHPLIHCIKGLSLMSM